MAVVPEWGLPAQGRREPESPKPVQDKEMQRRQYCDPVVERRRLEVENPPLRVVRAAPGVEIERLEVRRGVAGVESGMPGVENPPLEAENGALGVERGTLGLGIERSEVECETPEVSSEAPEVERGVVKQDSRESARDAP